MGFPAEDTSASQGTQEPPNPSSVWRFERQTADGGGMNFVRQRTLKSPIHCSGVGLHSGSGVSMTLYPAEPNSGIRFRRTDIEGGPIEVEATWHNAVEAPLCTTLIGRDGVEIATVEHLMSAFLGCGVDNAVVELDNREVPAMDGSAAPFVVLIDCIGTVEQIAPRRMLQVLKPVEVREPHRSACLSPSDDFTVEFEIDFDSPVVARQQWSVQVDDETYRREVASARTFGFLHEVAKLRAMGLALGGSLDNAIVIDHDRIVNEGGLRFDNEFVRHKTLDAIGDLFLAGGPLLGRFSGVRAGHALTLRLLRALFTDQSAWRWHAPLTLNERDSRRASAGGVPAERAVAAPA